MVIMIISRASFAYLICELDYLEMDNYSGPGVVACDVTSIELVLAKVSTCMYPHLCCR